LPEPRCVGGKIPVTWGLEPSSLLQPFFGIIGGDMMMNDKTKTLSEQARMLSPEDRIALIEDLLDSLDGADPTVDRLWAREAGERLVAYRRGDLTARDLHDVIAKYRP
jgi:putative addiction module component (TIGR02574 family)